MHNAGGAEMKEPNCPDMDKLSAYELALKYDEPVNSHNAIKASNNDEEKDPMVFHPNHYRRSGIEALDVIKAFELDYLSGNAAKYILRSRFKGKEIQDLEKAIFYLKIKVADLKKQNGTT